jgi:hypothetical protein
MHIHVHIHSISCLASSIQAQTFRGVMERRHPIRSTLSLKSKLAMKLFSKEPLFPSEKDQAIEHWGQAIVNKQEVRLELTR